MALLCTGSSSIDNSEPAQDIPVILAEALHVSDFEYYKMNFTSINYLISIQWTILFAFIKILHLFEIFTTIYFKKRVDQNFCSITNYQSLIHFRYIIFKGKSWFSPNKMISYLLLLIDFLYLQNLSSLFIIIWKHLSRHV